MVTAVAVQDEADGLSSLRKSCKAQPRAELSCVINADLMAIGYVSAGFVTVQLALVSLALLVPTFAGFAIGERLRNRLSEVAFRRWLLGVFLLMGLNLIRRAIF